MLDKVVNMTARGAAKIVHLSGQETEAAEIERQIVMTAAAKIIADTRQAIATLTRMADMTHLLAKGMVGTAHMAQNEGAMMTIATDPATGRGRLIDTVAMMTAVEDIALAAHQAHIAEAGTAMAVAFLVAQGLDREFIKWAQAPFKDRGLKTDVIFLTSHTPPRDSIIQVHILEGVIAVVDLNSREQANGKIPLQVFNRQAGASNVRFDGYQDLAPSVAADVVLRAKSAAVIQQPPQYHAHQAPYSQGYQGAPGHGQPYAPSQAAGYSPVAPATTTAPTNGIDLASLVGQLDNTALAQLLGAMQATQATPTVAPSPATTYGQPPAAAQYAPHNNATQQSQLAALLSSLGASTASPTTAPSAYASTTAPYARGLTASQPVPTGYQTAAPQGLDEQALQALMAHFVPPRQ
ncbi:hypothetical protein SPBR_07348 [Sporothrix brasiliensis 5110]|uniref:Uncharacterized protein n=1 Tax=Sporothrix brasiliensis 5110 TaxID=1398154 RepID=A0A0C2FD81_9PEZI|nr:uncharacterized protein SPBR_07348 [Sporothrix brasiliensis 5110]KIH89088.1 hypothetical protein SPBR_07348 [Sporothrix brasiliensis 5110]